MIYSEVILQAASQSFHSDNVIIYDTYKDDTKEKRNKTSCFCDNE